MREQVVTPITAKLANLKGFNISCDKLYRGDNLIDSHHGYDFDISAPTQSILQTWLRDKKEVDIEVELCTDHELIVCYPRTYQSGYYTKDGFNMVEGFYSTYEEALEEGLQGALAQLTLIRVNTKGIYTEEI